MNNSSGRCAQFEIGRGDVLDDVGDLGIGHRGADQRAERGILVGLAAKRDLIKFLAVLLDAENADMADMVMAAGIDAAGNIDVQPAEIALQIEIAEAPRDLLRDRDRARIGEAAIIEAGAGDDVGDEIDVRRGDADRVERAPQRRQIALRDMRQHQILLVADADFAERVTIGEVGDRIHLLGGGIAGRAAFRLQRQRDDGVAGHLVIGDRIVDPGVKAAVGAARCGKFRRVVIEPRVGRIAEAAGDFGNDPAGSSASAPSLMALPFGVDFLCKSLGAKLVHQNLDARLVDIVAPAELIVGAQDRLDVAQHVALMQERLDGLGEERRSAEAAADHDLEADFAGAVAVQAQRQIMDAQRGAVVASRCRPRS